MVNKGMVSATLSADRKRYSIGVSNNGVQLALRRFDPSKFPGDLDVEESRDRSFAPLLSNALIAKKRTAEQSQIPIVTATSPINGVEMPAGPKEFRNIDVLVLYTARALNRAGGDAPLGTAIVDSINQANQALRNSGINTFAFRRVLPAELSSQVNYDEVFSATNLMLNPSCTLAPRNCALVSHRMWVRRESNLPNGQINSLRAAANADLVVLMYETQDSLAGTGAAYLQKLDCGSFPAGGESAPGCDRGLAYRDFSFSVVGIQSTTLGFVFAHETGHQLGMEHNSRNAGANPSFPWSYAHYVSGKAQTILSGANGFECTLECPKVLQFSNPYVDFQGWPGTLSGKCSTYNALTAQILSRDTAELYSPVNPTADWLFASGFDELEIAPPNCDVKP